MLDILAMYWKECKELYLQRNRQLFSSLIVVLSLGGWLPYRIGRDWFGLPLVFMLLLAFVPAIFVITFVADSFAGERERHTLETLLATRLSDWSIVAGKVAALLTLPLGMTTALLVVSFVAANIRTPGDAWGFYSLDSLLITMLLSLLLSLLIISIGILVSLRAATVRQAQQTLSTSIAILSTAATFFGFQLARLPFVQELLRLSERELLIGMIGCVTLLDVVLIFLILVRFQRSRLIGN